MSVRALFHYHNLRKSLRQDPREREKIQIKKLQELLEHAYENVLFYRRKFRSANISPSDIKTLEDLAKIPFTTKSEIQSASMKDVVARNVNLENCINRMTSGSTGIPLRIIFEKEISAIETALLARTYYEDGLRFWHKMIRIADPTDFPKRRNWYQYLGLARIEHLSTFDRVDEQMKTIEKYRPDALRGFTSYIELLAHFCKQNEREMKIDKIFTSAELLDKQTRELIDSTFQTSLFDMYVNMEFGLVAWECPVHSGYHINSETVLLETLKNGEVERSGDHGEIICTSLVNKAMPLIRYKTGDVGAQVKEMCPCGITLPLLKIVEGRTGDFLTTPDGRIISPTMFFPYPFENVSWIKQFRIIQEKLDKLTIQLVPRESFQVDPTVLEKARKAIQELFGESMQVEFQVLDAIERNSGNKLRKIISKVPTSLYRQ